MLVVQIMKDSRKAAVKRLIFRCKLEYLVYIMSKAALESLCFCASFCFIQNRKILFVLFVQGFENFKAFVVNFCF